MFKYSRMENKSDFVILTVRYNLNKDLKYINLRIQNSVSEMGLN